MHSDSEPVTVVIRCVIKPDKLDAAKRELEAVIGKVMASESACRGIRVHEAPGKPHHVLIIEDWESKAVFIGPHMQTPHMREFLTTAETFLDGQAEFEFWRETLIAP